jgi:hypothetical protein
VEKLSTRSSLRLISCPHSPSLNSSAILKRKKKIVGL